MLSSFLNFIVNFSVHLELTGIAYRYLIDELLER